jgi:hypothetical protein
MVMNIFFFLLLSVGSGLYAQERQMYPSDQAIAQQSDGSVEGPRALTSTTDGNKSNDIKRFSQYNNFSYETIRPLAAEAEKNGFSAAPEEISAQEKAFRTMFPGMPVNQQKLRDEVIARKYSRSLNGTKISDGDIQNAYKQIQSEYSNGNSPLLSDLQPMLETRVLLENRSVQGKVQEIKEVLEAQENQAALKENERWSQEDVRMKGPSDECIARHKDSATCLLTIKQFNNLVRYCPVPKFMPLDTARVDALREILKNLYIANEARATGFASGDSAREEKQYWMYDFIEQLKRNKLGLLVRDRNAHWKAYSMFYDALFRGGYFPYFSILGSNDSLSIDSISRICNRNASTDSNNHKENAHPLSSASAIPWSYSRAVNLPEDFNGSLDSLPINGISGAIRTPYGFFLVRLDSVQIRNEISFNEAHDKLILLATKQKWFKMDSLLLEKARSLYTSNKRLNRLPDTLTVMAFLTPEQALDSLNEGKTAGKRGEKGDLKTDFKKPGVPIASTRLPFDVRDSLLSRYAVARDKKATIGPIHSRFGVWNFRVLDKKRGGVCPFSAVQKRLIDSLAVHELDCPMDISWKNPDSAFVETALAKSYAPRFFGTRGIEEESDQGSREILEQKKRARIDELDAWLSNITIRPVFFAHTVQ